MKIIVIGAGIGGLVAAEELARIGHQVRVIEKCEIKNLTYDWHDDVARDIFKELNLPLPDEKHYFPKGNWTFVTPDEKTEVFLELPEEESDLSIERREFAKLYIERAKKANVEFFFNTTVDSLIIEDNEVKGVNANGEKLYCDLVIDNSGVFSPFRASLPAKYNIEKNPNKDEVFFAYRAFHKRAEGSEKPKYTNKVYLKHLGEEGISWCIHDPSDTVNILIGRIGELPKTTLDNAYQRLKESNSIISDQLIRGGKVCAIPVRHPALRFSGKGYVLIGDSAFMTIPMLGSGLANSMLAARILTKEIEKSGNASEETLWKYQVSYYKKVGYLHTGADLVKRWLLKSNPKDVDFLFSKGVINEKDLKNGSVGAEIALTLDVIIDKVKKVFPKLGLLLKLKGVLDKSKKVQNLALAIPEKYDLKAINIWQNKVMKYFE